jgi:hypothetical protein
VVVGRRRDVVVPVAVEVTPCDVPVQEVTHLRVGIRSPVRVAALVEPGVDGQAGASGGRGDGLRRHRGFPGAASSSGLRENGRAKAVASNGPAAARPLVPFV